MKLLSKISVKTIHGPVDVRKFSEEENVQELFTVYGRAAAVKTGESDKGPWVAVLGEFKAIRIDGETFASYKFFPPSHAFAEGLQAMIALDAGPVDFAVKVTARYDQTAITRYVYDIENLMESRPSAALASIEQAIGIAPKELTDQDRQRSGTAPLALAKPATKQRKRA